MNPLIIQYFLKKKKNLQKLTGIINFANVNVEIPKNASLMSQFLGACACYLSGSVDSSRNESGTRTSSSRLSLITLLSSGLI
jgi:hypothetical protein